MKTTWLQPETLIVGLCLAVTTPLPAQHFLIGGPLRPGHARPPLRVHARPAAATYYNPAQIRHAYGFDQIPADGSGQKIAIVDAYGNGSIQSDLDTFCTQFGLPRTQVQIIGPNGSTDKGWALETALDVEWAHAIAPNATIILSVARSSSDADLIAAVDAAVQAGANVVSMSWGGTEWANESAYDSHFNVPGVTFVASSGDSGELNALPEVEWPAVSPYVVSVGGTSLRLDANNNRSSETAWSSGGGGLSSYYGTPIWQIGWNTWAQKRGVPDVSYDADPNTGVLVYDSVNGGLFVVGGTSAGAPQWAALIALANQSRATGLSGNADIYRVAGTAPTLDPTHFFDISSGQNGTDPDDISVTGYDLVTGLGSPVATGLVPALAALAPASPDFVVSMTPNSRTVAPGGSTTFTVTVTAVAGFSGQVGLVVSGLPNGATATPNPNSISGSGSYTVTVTTSATTPAGNYAISVTGTSGALTHTASANLVVAQADFAISASPSSRQVRHGSSTYYTVTITPSGGFTGSVALSVSGLPSGATASFSPASVTGSGSSRLTIRTSSSTPRATSTLTITGNSGALSHSTTVSLKVN